MSEAEQGAAGILLPGAKVSVFSKDAETLNSAALLKDDWRFARVNVDAVNGDVGNAIETFKNDGASDLIIIQTDEIDDNFTDRLGDLSNYCDEGTSAIVIGPVNDVDLYRKLIDMGVSDYLVRPVSTEVMTDIISKALIKRLGVSDSRLIAFIGANGGVGTSVIAQACALITSRTMEQQVLLMDAAGGCSSLSVGMGFDPAATLLEVSKAVEAKNEDALKRMFCKIDDKLSILATGADAMLDPSVTAAQYEAVLDNLLIKSPIVFVDLSSASSVVRKAVIARAHQTIVVTTPTVTSLRFCRSLLKEISDVRGGEDSDVSLVVNKAGISKANEVAQGDISEALEFNVSAVINYLPELFLKYESDMRDLIFDKEFEDVATAFLPILGKYISTNNAVIEDASSDSSGLLGSLLSKLTSK